MKRRRRSARYDTPVTILTRETIQDPVFRTESEGWVEGVTFLAEVEDMLPSRAERVADGVELAKRPARIRTHFRTDIGTADRLKIGERVLQVVAGPAELGRRETIELLAEEVSTLGAGV